MEPDNTQPTLCVVRLSISIHGLRVEPDSYKLSLLRLHKTFQSTGSVWSPTEKQIAYAESLRISIHGLRVEPDTESNF